MSQAATAARWTDIWWSGQIDALRFRFRALSIMELLLLAVGGPLWLYQQPIPWEGPWPFLWLAALAIAIAVIGSLLIGRKQNTAPGWAWRFPWHVAHVAHGVLWGVGYLFLAPVDPNTANGALALLAVAGGYALIPLPLTFTTFQLGLLLPATGAISLGFLWEDTSIFIFPAAGLAILLTIGALSFCHSLWRHCDDLHQQRKAPDGQSWGEEKQELEDTIVTLRQLSMYDSLTKLTNRRGFDHTYAREWRRSRRQKTPISVLMLDIDHFKQYNDEYGHLQGDDCLRKVGEVLEQYTRRGGDLAARYGGEEFVVLLPDTPVENALRLADTIRNAIADLGIVHGPSSLGVVTVTVGVAGAGPDDEKQKAKTLLQRADDALYKGKEQGRNRVTVAPDPGEEITEAPKTQPPTQRESRN